MNFTILFLPGYACTSQIWNSVRPSLEARYQCTWMNWPHELLSKFHSIADFADWLEPFVKQEQFNVLIGHSMGGLVALELASRTKKLMDHLILVETFLVSPPTFFQNSLMEFTPEEISNPILEMLRNEKAVYSPTLAEGLRELNKVSLISNVEASITVLHGDRGCHNPQQVLSELAWPQELLKKVEVKMIEDACHFPMVENAKMTEKTLLELVESKNSV